MIQDMAYELDEAVKKTEVLVNEQEVKPYGIVYLMFILGMKHNINILIQINL